MAGALTALKVAIKLKIAAKKVAIKLALTKGIFALAGVKSKIAASIAAKAAAKAHFWNPFKKPDTQWFGALSINSIEEVPSAYNRIIGEMSSINEEVRAKRRTCRPDPSLHCLMPSDHAHRCSAGDLRS